MEEKVKSHQKKEREKSSVVGRYAEISNLSFFFENKQGQKNLPLKGLPGIDWLVQRTDSFFMNYQNSITPIKLPDFWFSIYFRVFIFKMICFWMHLRIFFWSRIFEKSFISRCKSPVWLIKSFSSCRFKFIKTNSIIDLCF